MSGFASEPLARAAYVAQQIKERLVRRQGRGNDVEPVLLCYRAGEQFAVCNLKGCWADRYNVLRHTVAVLVPDEVVLVVETFCDFTPNVAPSNVSLSQRFAAGDANVSEAIHVLHMTPDGDGQQTIIPYTYSGRSVVWSQAPRLGVPGEPAPVIELFGDIPDSLMAGFTDAGIPYALDEARAVLEPMGVRIFAAAETDAFTAAGRNDPCPCGSGKKFKHCHGSR